MTPEQLADLLSGPWPPPTLHWPPKDESTWREGMTLIGVIETTKQLPRNKRYAKSPDEHYTAVVLRRYPDGARITYHGYRTADEDLGGMPLDPGLLFGVVYLGEGANGFKNLKHWTTTYDQPGATAAAGTSQSQSQGSSSSNGTADPSQLTTVASAKAYVNAQGPEWQATFKRLAQQARDAGEAAQWSQLQGFQVLIARTDERMAAT